MLRVWNLSLVVATFCLTILGTFLTRSGVVNSVHSFTQSAIGPLLLGFLALVGLVAVGLIAWRADLLRSPGSIDSPVSREAAFLANNLLFGAFAFVVLLGTVFPLLAEAYDGRQLSVGEPYFDQMTMPIGFALLFLMAVAPALPWRAASIEVMHRRLAIPAWTAAGAMAIATFAGMRGIAPVLTLGLATFALAGIGRQFGLAAASRRRLKNERWPVALTGAVASNRRLYGGLIVHAGVVLVAVAFAFSSAYSVKREARLAPGESTTIRGYKVTFLGIETATGPRKATVSARLRVERGGRVLGAYGPALSTFPGSPQAIGTPSVRTGLAEDLYLTLISSPRSPDGEVVVGMRANPLVVWLWIGGAVMAAGTVVAAWAPLRRRRRPTEDSTSPPVPARTEGAGSPDLVIPLAAAGGSGAKEPG